MVRLSETGKIITGNTPKTSDQKNYASNDIPFVKPSDISECDVSFIKLTEYWISEYAREKARILPVESVLITCIGIIGKVAITERECAFNQQINAIIPNDNYLPEYLAYAILAKQSYLQEIANAPVVPIINKSQFGDIEIQDADLRNQRIVVDKLNAISHIISLSNAQLKKLDELVKSRFVEMFENHSCCFQDLPLNQICEIIDGDRGKAYPKQEDFFEKEYCLFLNAKNVTPSGFDFSKCMFITKEKDEILRKGKLKRGDIVLTTRGTIGNLAFYTNDIPFDNIRINSGMVILRMEKTVSEVFFIHQFRMKLNEIKTKIVSGTAQPQLPISTMKNIKMIVPPINLQTQFANFVAKVEQQKATVQKSIDKLETLKKSLMQEYFG